MAKKAPLTQESIIWPITPGWKAGQSHSLLDPAFLAEALAWAAEVKRPMAEQKAIEAAARARRAAEV